MPLSPLISVAVMTHPTRLRLAQEVVHALRSDSRVAVILDPVPWGEAGSLRTALGAWRAVSPDATHHLVVQDDTVLADNFLVHLENAIRTFPDRPIAFYSNWASRNGMAVRFGALAGAKWTEATSEYVPSLALAMSREQIEGFINFAEGLPDQAEPDDEVMEKYFNSAGLRLMLTIPNLVEHRHFKSLVGNDDRGIRSAACFSNSVSEDWLASGGAVVENIDQMPLLRFGRMFLYSKAPPTSYKTSSDITSVFGWYKQNFETSASQFGIDIDAAVSSYNDFMGAQPLSQVGAWFKIISPKGLWSLWLSGLVLGQSRYIEPFSRIGDPGGSDERFLDSMLYTLILGGLRPDADQATLFREYEAFVPVVQAGMDSVKASTLLREV